jgi:hypothetical protein
LFYQILKRLSFFHCIAISTLISAFFLVLACQNAQSPTAAHTTTGEADGLNRQFLAGVWTNQAFVEAVEKHDSPYNRFDCTELYFDAAVQADTLWLNRCQLDVAQLAYTHKGKDTLFIADWQQKGASIVRLGNDALRLINHNNQQNTVFVRAAERYIEGEQMPPFKYSYRRLINEQTISGNYQIIYPSSAAKREVLFNGDGSLSGLSDFSKYTLWIGGDKGSMCSENIMSFNNMQIDTLYGWHQRGDTLLLCNLKNVGTDDGKPQYEFNKIAIKLLRQQPTDLSKK